MSSTRELKAADLLSRDEIRAFTRTADLGGAVAIAWTDRKSTRLNSSHCALSRMPSSA